MHNPFHPDEVLRELCLEPLGLSVTGAAQALGTGRKNSSAIVNGTTGINPEMALRLFIASTRLRRAGWPSSRSTIFGGLSSIAANGM